MEIFFAYRIDDGFAFLDAEESAHCVRVLRHRAGDEIAVIARPIAQAAGKGRDIPAALYRCVITDESPKGVVARVESVCKGWGSHPYYLRMAVCPTKNIDRYEWFVEKAVELGVDEIIPLIGEHSERRVVRVDRLQKIAVSAAKQSLKGRVPIVAEPVSVLDFIAASSQGKADCSGSCPNKEIRLIAYCSDDVAPRGSIIDALAEAFPSEAGKGQVCAPAVATPPRAGVTVLIGPEGDFSKEEVTAAIAAGYESVHLGPSRLRTETAAITAVEAVYLTLGLATSPYNSV